MFWLFGLLWKTSLLSKSCCGYFLDYAWQHLGSFISTSGHTDDDADDDKTLLKIGCGGDGGVSVAAVFEVFDVAFLDVTPDAVGCKQF